jgi:peptidoglycan/xylan/chitin deacetylase (PgdA/CDA1 family)
VMVVRNVDRIRSAVARRSRVRVRRMQARLSGARRPVILLYHRLASETFDPWGLAVAPDNFAEQLAWLAGHRSLFALAEFARLHRRGSLPDDAAAVTFDDGYACTAKVAAPLLEWHDVPATIFIPAGLIGKTRVFWWDELREIVMNHPDSSLDALGRTFDIGGRQDLDAVWPSDNRRRTPRQKGFYALWTQLQPLPTQKIERTLSELLCQYPASLDDDRHRLMTDDEVRSIGSDLIEFGSHAMTHVSLPGLRRAEKAVEIQNSVDACEKLVGTRPLNFAYPFGDFDAECAELVADAGFACACTVESRSVTADDNVFALPRIKVGNWSARQLKQELANAAYEQVRSRA